MSWTRAALVVALLLAGCERKHLIVRLMDDWRAHRDAMCACVDRACADAAEAEFKRWSEEKGPLVISFKGIPEEQANEYRSIISAREACRDRLRK